MAELELWDGSNWQQYATKNYVNSLITPQLSALSSLSTTGIMVRTGANIFATRNLVGGAGINILNADGVLGNITVGISSIAITQIAGYSAAPTDSFVRGNNSWSKINSSIINFDTELNSGGKNINVQTGTLLANNLAASTSSNIYCISPLSNLKLGNDFSLNGYKITNGGTSTIGFTGGTLDIFSGITVSRYYSYGWLNKNGATGATNGSNFYSLVCTDRVAASEFNATSSKKIKNIECNTNNIIQALKDQFLKLNFYKYSYIDERDGKGDHYGIIAEDLAHIFPQFVDLERKRYVPNCVNKGKMTKIFFKYLKKDVYIFSHKLDLTIIDKKSKLIKLFINDNFYEVEIKKITPSTLEVIFNVRDLPNVKHYLVKGSVSYVYGTYEKCPTVEKNKLAEIGLILLQDLIKKVELLEKRAN